MEQYFHICGSPADPDAGVILLECESFALRGETSEDDTAPNCGTLQQVSGVIPSVTEQPAVWARFTSTDLFDLLESKPVWSIEELAEVLKVSPKTLYKQAKRGSFPSFRIGSCVRVYSKGLVEHLRGKMKK